MRPGIRLIGLVVLALGAMGLWAAVAAAAAANGPATTGGQTSGSAPVVSAADAQQLIDILQDPARRAALITTLENLRKVAPAAPGPAVTAPGPQAEPAPAPAAPPPANLGAQLMAHGAQLADTVSSSVVAAIQGVANLPDLLRWLRQLAQDPEALLGTAIAVGRLLCVAILAFGGEFLAWRLTRRLYAALAADAHSQERAAAQTAPATAMGHALLSDGWLLLLRLPIIVMALTIDLVPPLAFLAVGYLAAGTPLVASGEFRVATLTVIDAYVIVRVVGAVARAAFGAPFARLRLLAVSDATALYLRRWVRRISTIIIAGYAVAQCAVLLGMDEPMRQAVLRLISLLVHVMLIVMVLQSRRRVAAWLSGADTGFFGTLRHRLASAWHIYAIIFIAAGWVIYAYEIRNGLAELLHFMLWTLVVALAARVADIVLVGALDRGFTVAHDRTSGFALIKERASHYQQPLRILLRTAIGVIAGVALLQALGVNVGDWFSQGAPGGRLANTLITLLVTLGVAIALWEATNIGMQVYLDRLTREGIAMRAARLQTIVPLLRNSLLIILMVLIALTAMSELGVNIGPLLAGASIFGVAIGFGSQKLVQDFITGIFLLLENAMQVGDTVTAGGLSGTVENLSIRTLRLRAGDGSVHVIPFSSVSTVTNSNRGLGNASVSVTVDYREDSDRVADVLSSIGKAMRSDKAFADGMLSDLQLWGVDRVDGSTMTLAGQIVCTDGARWGVQREFNRRVKLAFEAAGIRMMPTNVSIAAFREPLAIRLDRPIGEQPEAKAAPAGRAMAHSDAGRE